MAPVPKTLRMRHVEEEYDLFEVEAPALIVHSNAAIEAAQRSAAEAETMAASIEELLDVGQPQRDVGDAAAPGGFGLRAERSDQ